MSARTHEGRTLRLLTLLDEYTRECLAIRVERRMGSQQIIEALSDVMLWRGIPEQIRSDNGPEFIAQELRQWLANLGTGTLSTSNRAVPGRTGTARVSMGSCGTNA